MRAASKPFLLHGFEKNCVYFNALQTAFTGADAVIMLGAFPRKDGMERKDLLEKNCGIFKEQVLRRSSCSLNDRLYLTHIFKALQRGAFLC
jgi:malate/lactate dehydrogenase